MFSEINNHILCWSADNAGIIPTRFSPQLTMPKPNVKIVSNSG